MTDIDVLRRRYQRWLWAYPNWYRRERGREMLTTLLDAARPGQRRPTGREICDLTARGVLCRLRVPRGPGYRLVAVVAACFAALAGCAVTGTVLSRPPSEQRAIALAEAALGQRPHNIPGPRVHCPDYCSYRWERGGDQVVIFDEQSYRNGGINHTAVGYWNVGPDAVGHARDRLLASGWTIDSEAYPPEAVGSGPSGPPVDGFTAYRGTLSLHVHRMAGPSSPSILLTLERNPPPALLWTAAAGSLLAGWLMFSWALQRGRRHTTGRKAAIVLLGAPPLMVMGMIEVFMVPLLVLASLGTSLPAALAPAAGLDLLVTTIPWLPAATALAAGLAIAVAALPTRGHLTVNLGDALSG